MADLDEVDILGDLPLSEDTETCLLDKNILVSENSDLLNCDYTIHPQWLLDKPSTNPDNWYNENAVATSTLDGAESEGINTSVGQFLVENCISDESGWTDKEKNLLERGLEIFGKSSLRLSQFVGTKSSSEVKYYLKNFFTGSLSHYSMPDRSNDHHLPQLFNSDPDSDIVHSDQIPASIEEVIGTVKKEKESLKVKTIKLKQHKVKPVKKKDVLLSPKKNTLQSEKSSMKTKRIITKNLNVKDEDIKKESTDSDINFIKMKDTSCAVPISEGEEIVKIQKADDDSSDISIDIDDDQDVCETNYSNNDDSKISTENFTNHSVENEEENLDNQDIMDEDTAELINSLEEPKVELNLNQAEITKLEKYINSDFFEGKSAKTPERYVKIRNHILNSWLSSKPNYVYKTAMRSGLKNCGDVTCISRIHNFLEQIGAINFGCELTKYERPLSNMLHLPISPKCRTKQTKIVSSREFTKLGPRQRFKRKFHNDGDGGCTIVHGDGGEIIDTTIINEQKIAKPAARTQIKRPTIRLIYCRPFPADIPQQYSIKISLSTLLLMDFHSHCYLTEVMGLIGGTWKYEGNSLNITAYEPCTNIASSTTHCDMCPISQAKAAENIHSQNLEIFGWFHSHPTFAPEPSQQDIDTQISLQQWIGHGQQCIGVILSPFSVNAALISSPFRCWMVHKKANHEDQFIPYRFNVDIVVDDFKLDNLLTSIQNLVLLYETTMQNKMIPFDKPYFQDSSISHLDKFISSVNMHLAKIGALAKSHCDEIINGIKKILRN